MKKAATIILSIFLTVWEVGEVLFLPALLALLGVLNQLPWQYYAIFIGGYFALLFIGELAIHLVFRALNKKYSSPIARKLQKIIDRFSNKEKNGENLPTEDN